MCVVLHGGESLLTALACLQRVDRRPLWAARRVGLPVGLAQPLALAGLRLFQL